MALSEPKPRSFNFIASAGDPSAIGSTSAGALASTVGGKGKTGKAGGGSRGIRAVPKHVFCPAVSKSHRTPEEERLKFVPYLGDEIKSIG